MNTENIQPEEEIVVPIKTLKELANDAIQMQDACNGFAIANAYGKTMSDLRKALTEAGEPTGTNDLRNHPINRLWASKINDLAGMGISDMDRFSEAYNWCVKQLES